MENLNNSMVTYTKLPKDVQSQRLRQFAKVDISTKLKILDLQKQKFHHLKSLYREEENNVITLASLVLAIDFRMKEMGDTDLKVSKLKQASYVKRSLKKEKLLCYWGIVRDLKLNKNLSFREIASYLKRYHKFEIVHSSIYKIWSEIEINEKETKHVQ